MTPTYWLVLTTLPHFFCCLVAPDTFYRTIVLQATSFRLLWYVADYPVSLLKTFQLTWAVLWILTELWYAKTAFHQNSVLVWNYYLFLLHQLAEELIVNRRLSPHVAWSFWNLLSATKCLLVVSYLS